MKMKENRHHLLYEFARGLAFHFKREASLVEEMGAPLISNGLVKRTKLSSGGPQGLYDFDGSVQEKLEHLEDDRPSQSEIASYEDPLGFL